MGWWELLLKKDKNTIIEIKEFKGGNYEEAHSYFRKQKQLNTKDFDKLFIVKRKIVVPKNYKWWKEEILTLDIEND